MNFDRLFLFRTTFSLIILALLPGCVANRPYRLQGVAGGIYEKKFPGQQQPSREYEAMPGHNYRLPFVEFDEKGDFWDRGQLAIAASRIKHSPKPVLLVVFIHGWHHNAAERPALPRPSSSAILSAGWCWRKRWRRQWLAASSRRTRRPAAAPSALPPTSCCWLIPLRNRSTRKSSPTCFESSGIADTLTPTA